MQRPLQPCAATELLKPREGSEGGQAVECGVPAAGLWLTPEQAACPEPLPRFQVAGISRRHPSGPTSLPDSLPSRPALLCQGVQGYAYLWAHPFLPFTTISLVGLPPRPLKKGKTG